MVILATVALNWDQAGMLTTARFYLQKFLQRFTSVAKPNASIIQLKPSVYERHTEAMFVHDSRPVYALGEDMMREISHVHATGDYSAHVVLSPQDAKKVIDSGWGQLHPLAGRRILKRMVGIMVPREYVLLYAPRDGRWRL